MAKVEDELQALLDSKRGDLGIAEEHGKPKSVAEVVAVSLEVSEERRRRDEAKRLEWKQAEERRAADEMQRRLEAAFYGKRRYINSHVNNFECHSEEQRAAIEKIKQYKEQIDERVDSGSGMLLFGPPGTGKDHLMAYLIHVAVLRNHHVKWVNGMDLFGDARDRMDDDRKTERGLLEMFLAPTVLAISDPLPPFGNLTVYQAGLLFRIIDARYSARKATWMTLNVKDDKEADERLGSATVDRLTHDALVIPCNWPSYRKPR